MVKKTNTMRKRDGMNMLRSGRSLRFLPGFPVFGLKCRKNSYIRTQKWKNMDEKLPFRLVGTLRILRLGTLLAITLVWTPDGGHNDRD